MTNRSELIDFIRGMSIIFIILIHILSTHKDNIYLFYIWDTLHFVVISIIFASGASAFFARTSNLITLNNYFNYAKKRFVRLIIPWYKFILIYFFILYFLCNANIYDCNITLTYILSSIFLFGMFNGIGYGWLLITIFFLSLLSPILINFHKKYNYLLILGLLFFFSFLMQIVFHFNRSVLNGKLVFFIPVIFVFYLGMLYADYKIKEKTSLNFLILLLFINLAFKVLCFLFNKSIYVTSFKYPPNFIYIFYGLLITFMLIHFFKLFNNSYITYITYFFSINSLWFYLWHILAIDLKNVLLMNMNMHFNLKLIFEIVIVFIITTSLVLIQNKLKNHFIKIRIFSKKNGDKNHL